MFSKYLCQTSMGIFMLLAALPLWAHTPPPMTYRDLCQAPGICKRISRLILGTDHLGKLPQAQTEAVLNEAVKLGINTFDTAPIYTDDIEIRLGRWLKSQSQIKNSPRLYVISKGGFPRDLGPGTYQSRLKGSASEITTQVLEELNHSKSSYSDPIDIYLMHRDDADFLNYQRVKRPQTPVETILQALSDPRLTSQFDFLGLSNWETERVHQAREVAQSHPEWIAPVCNSPYFSLLEMGTTTIHSGGVQVKHSEMMSTQFQQGIALMPYSPLGGFSIFSGGWEKARKRALALKNKHDRYWSRVYDALFHEANAQRYARAEAFTRRFNQTHNTDYSLDQMVNAYALAHPRSDYLIIGPRSVSQLRRTVAALHLAKQLTAADLDYLYAGIGPSTAPSPRLK